MQAMITFNKSVSFLCFFFWPVRCPASCLRPFLSHHSWFDTLMVTGWSESNDPHRDVWSWRIQPQLDLIEIQFWGFWGRGIPLRPHFSHSRWTVEKIRSHFPNRQHFLTLSVACCVAFLTAEQVERFGSSQAADSSAQKTKLSSLCFAELELKEKGGSQEGKWVRSCDVAYFALPVRPGLLNWCRSFKLDWISVQVCTQEGGGVPINVEGQAKLEEFCAPSNKINSPFNSVHMCFCGNVRQPLPRTFRYTPKYVAGKSPKLCYSNIFFLYDITHASSVCVRLSKFCQPSPTGEIDVGPKKGGGTSVVRVPRKPEWNCTFNPIYMEHSIHVWKKRQNESILS